MSRPRRKAISFSAAILTISDKASQGRREDLAGPALAQALATAGIEATVRDTVSDDPEDIVAALKRFADEMHIPLVVTTGGTGLSPRDNTPEATASVIERPVPGLAEAMRLEGLKHTPRAMLSRGLAGVRGSTLIINLPGSPKGALENLEAMLEVLTHALEKLQGDQSDCARPL